jgi:FtsX extracellular domain
MTDLLDQLRESDPARGRLPELAFDDVRDRFVVAPRPRSRRVLPIALAAAVAVALGIGWNVRRSPSQAIVKAGPTPVTIPANLVAEAMALAPESQRKALADGYVSNDEMNRAGAAMAACMSSEGSGPPQQWDELGGGVRLPIKLDDRDDTCERQHTLWLKWAFRVQAQVTLLGDSVASVFMNPDATTEQIATVRAELAARFPDATIRFVDKPEAKSEFSILFPNTQDFPLTTDDMPTSFRIATIADLGPLNEIARMPAINLVRRVSAMLEHPPTDVEPQPLTTTAIETTVPARAPLTTAVAVPGTLSPVQSASPSDRAAGMPIAPESAVITFPLGTTTARAWLVSKEPGRDNPYLARVCIDFGIALTGLTICAQPEEAMSPKPTTTASDMYPFVIFFVSSRATSVEVMVDGIRQPAIPVPSDLLSVLRVPSVPILVPVDQTMKSIELTMTDSAGRIVGTAMTTSGPELRGDQSPR